MSRARTILQQDSHLMDSKRWKRTTIGLVLAAFGLFVMVSVLTHDPLDPGPFPDHPRHVAAHVSNACGLAGSYVSAYALAALGWMSVAGAILVAVAGLMILTGTKPKHLWARAVGIFEPPPTFTISRSASFLSLSNNS